MKDVVKAHGVASLDLERHMSEMAGRDIQFTGAVQRLRRVGWGAFIVVRLPRSLVQCVASSEGLDYDLDKLREGDIVTIDGKLVAARIKDITISPRTVEVQVTAIRDIVKIAEPLPIDLAKKELNLNLDTKLDWRPISLRHPLERAVFKIEEGICRGFRDALLAQDFTEIHTPKLVFAGAEGGANIFKVEYFGRSAFLAQSPQFYKQYGVGIYGRVFEVAPVFRAEKHQTSRHLNEYTSLDYEMSPITGHEEIMGLEILVLRYILARLRAEYSYELEMTGARLPELGEEVPRVTLAEAHDIIHREYGKDFRGEPDLEPEAERLLCRWSAEHRGSEFIFVTHYPSEKRPFYAKDDPAAPGTTLSFDLLCRGLEITTGGQRINDYEEQVAKLRSFGMNPDEFQSFLQFHKYGAPPHGGLGMGLERLTAQLLGLENIREATMYPRDIKRLTP
ncbi:aspartate--tRNA(Asn) ligase [bacterium]|nr:aspartate--tRNA(Asn) ligase [candidate division CSSED10-310 bacterium]